jgi:hypothetical protein
MKLERISYASIYIFIRTRGIDPDSHLAGFFEDAWYVNAEVAFSEEETGWDDGLVVITDAGRDPYDIASDTAGELGKLAAWAIWQPGRAVDPVEFPPSSAVTAFHDWVQAQPGELAPVLMFIRFLAAPDHRDERAIDRIKETLARQSQRCSEIFRFRDGVVLATTAMEPLSILGQRLVKDCKFFRGWCLVCGGVTWAPPDSDAGIHEIEFTYEDDEEDDEEDDDDDTA